MARMRDTKLFKETADYVKPITKRQYEHELVLVKKYKDSRFNEDVRSIAGGFVWQNTPQGADYWIAVSHIIAFNQRNLYV